METLSLDAWTKYRDILKACSDKAADEFRDAIWKVDGKWGGVGLGKIPRDEIIDYAYALVTKYSEASSAAACEFYDAIAALSGVTVPPAIPAESATIGQVAKTVNGTLKTKNDEIVSAALGRLVKQCGQDTTLQNAKRDGAEFAWIPSGDTCAFCLALASRGWQDVGSLYGYHPHAEHIHSNCDCAYGVRFNSKFQYQGYDPDEYLEMYNNADGSTPEEKINSMRRDFYQENKEEIQKQKRDAYAKRKELNSSEAEEDEV